MNQEYIYLLAVKCRGAINIASMKYFDSLLELEGYIGRNTDEYNWSFHHAYRIPHLTDNKEAKAFSAKEKIAVGLRRSNDKL